ncbi:PAS domain S-box-containing protein [Tangfeifania diversioriginum]|uniref:histidine kinase n=1 Tax=Tangfeifania diversioriginum TaxID=1168035 RepID=A0A1M6MRQ5_9BACT|nr:PAS domain S-box protein [Tangfeifania diversioriginum]SHJ86188.1 PAS domain S-box-containing protein [Tangfeifania diversioriginum]
MIVNLIQNSALLISLSVLYGLIKWYKPQNEILYQVSQGIWFGAVAIAAMMMPYAYSPGVIYDGRSVVLTLAGLFGGGYTALISVLMAGAYRIYLGGSGIWAGLATILFSSLTGLFFRWLFKSKLENIQFIRFILIGVVAHLVMLASQLLLPGNERYEVISLIWLPVLLVLPITFAVIAKLFQLIVRYVKNEQKIREAETLYRTTLLSIGDAVICTDKKGNISQMNAVAEQLTGWEFAAAKEKKLDQIFSIINEETREKVESPFVKVLESGLIVGLANHTLLISKDGREIPIADSGAPIKNEKGEITGVVLVFRDQTEEREYQKRIARSEAQYRELIESTHAIAWEYDILMDKWVYVAPQVTEKLGWLPEEWTNLNFWKNNLHPDDREPATNYCFACAAKGEQHTLEYRFKKKDGDYVWLRDVVAVEMKENKPVKIRGVMFDITERKNAEIGLQEKNSFIQTVLDNLPIGIALNKIDEGTAFYMNRRFEEIYGWKASEIKDIPSFFEKVYPDQEYRSKVVQMIMEGIESGDPQKMHWEDIQISRSDGSKGFVNAVNIPLTEQNTMVSTVMDITSRTLAEKELKESEERFRKAVLLAPIPIMVHDEDGNVINLSEGWTHFSGYFIDEIPTLKEWTQMAYGKKAEEVENYVAGMFDEEKTILSGEFEITAKSGEKRVWNFYTTPLGKLSSGKRIMLSMAPDITQRKRVQNELITAKEKAEESERLKTAFLANMSHEIRTPLNGILGFTNLLTDDGELPQTKKQEFATIINKSAEGLLKIINDILDISRLETGKTGIEQKPFDASKTLSTIHSIFQKKMADTGKKDVELIVKKPETPLVLNTDENRLMQIFSNLLDNALRFTSEGSVTFGISQVIEGKAEFFVADTGTGIPKEKHGKIFDRFSQADDSSTRSYGGTGLGLSIVKKLLELMDTEITVESEPGKGSVFRFRLPVFSMRESDEKVSNENPEKPEETMNTKILVVEDDSVSRLYFNQILKNHTSELLFAETGKEALQLFETQKPDVILMDIGLPDINGLDVVCKIRETNQKVVIIAQTAYAMIDDRQKALEAGCNDYIAKPIKTDELMEKIVKISKIK